MNYSDIEKLMNPVIKGFKIYDAMPSNETLIKKHSIDSEKIVKLNGNENPFGPIPEVIDNLINIPINTYPDPELIRSRESLSDYTGLSIDNIVVSSGSDELIDIFFRIFVTPGDEVLDFTPTFGMYAVRAGLAGAKIVPVPRNNEFELDYKAISSNVSDKTKIIFLASPNNPTGNESTLEDIEFLLSLNKILVVDEAYFEFAKSTYAHLVEKYNNLVVIRSMSKWAGLAGLRVGYGLMSKDLAKLVMGVKNPYNVSTVAEESLITSLKYVDKLMYKVDEIIDEREKLIKSLGQIKSVKVYPSKANFLLCKLDNHNLQFVNNGLLSEGVFVRLFATKGLEKCFRVSIGSPDDNQYFYTKLQKVLKSE